MELKNRSRTLWSNRTLEGCCKSLCLVFAVGNQKNALSTHNIANSHSIGFTRNILFTCKESLICLNGCICKIYTVCACFEVISWLIKTDVTVGSDSKKL